MNKRFSSSPLPFRGSKRYYIKRFREVLAQADDIDTVVDLFGGSGLLSRVAKDMLPNCRVIYNDFDHYDQRLANVANTNALLRSIAPLVATVPDNKKIPAETKKQYWSYALRQRRNTRSITSRFQAHFCFRETGRKAMSS